MIDVWHWEYFVTYKPKNFLILRILLFQAEMHLRGYCIVSKFLVGGSNQCAFRISVVHDRKEKKYTFNNRDEQYNRIRLFRTKASL